MMMRRLMILAVATAACSGGGDSTTAAETVADTSSTGPGETSPPQDTDPGETDSPTTDASTTAATGDTGDTDSAETTTGDTMGDTTAGDCTEVGLAGEWLSEGENVAPLLVDLAGLVSVHASFEEVTFEVSSTDTEGTMGQQSGTYTTELCPGSETKYRIVLDQTVPNAILAEGIFEIDGCEDPAVMRYEVIQTQPDVGAVAPTCDDDFGTGNFGADNIQIFVRQP